MPTRLTASPSELTTSSWDVFISGGSRSRWIASNTMKIEIRQRKRPLAKPERVSTREYLASRAGRSNQPGLQQSERERETNP